jgi:hypothetical protein
MEEEQEVKDLISAVAQSGGTDVDSHFNRYKSIVSTRFTVYLFVELAPRLCAVS